MLSPVAVSQHGLFERFSSALSNTNSLLNPVTNPYTATFNLNLTDPQHRPKSMAQNSGKAHNLPLNSFCSSTCCLDSQFQISSTYSGP